MKIFKTCVRGCIYVAWMVAAVAVLFYPCIQYVQTQTMDQETLLLHAVLGFALIYSGTEFCDFLKRRWQDG
ncbi:MAG TPA: hypothetical protein IAC25_02365 [Candidatus Enterenecus stercoripullorum]|nr:hypothetical protein [Candidatus Enterenecus stercoripullorum]